ncbi:MAG TPA: hypothetical protein DDW65_07950 [Firmicutes bacterium]|jgi:glycosyltransferase involved in cell wall biosynthesis|nr:hypothetical protein [Bacillota bacterium]
MNQTYEYPPIEQIVTGDGTKQHVLVVASETSPATRLIYEIPFRVLSVLSVSSGMEFCWRSIPEYRLKLEDLQDINILILYRCIQDSTLSLARFARLIHIKVIYELDDDLLEPPENESWGQRYRTSHLSQIIQMFLAEVDLVKAGSPELAGRLKKKGYQAVYQPYTANICDLPIVDTTKLPYRVGYFGSPHHQNDIELIFSDLMALKELFQEKIEFEFIGCYPRDWQQLEAGIFPYQPDYELFLKFLAGRCWSLGLAPLRRTSFNEAKSNSKFRDYTAAGVLGIYADLPPYRDSIRDGQNGWLVKDSSESWYEIIEKALLCVERSAMLQRARELLQAAYSPETVALNWVTLFRDI